ncbi:helix-turn-helix transcriptional regulator, partial [Nocardia farcinica]|uniref:helix-turn-helix transcriptional regulator n=1 Tax=Nocardia farcinica TaxID=37329 RepID=UPI002457C644
TITVVGGGLARLDPRHAGAGPRQGGPPRPGPPPPRRPPRPPPPPFPGGGAARRRFAALTPREQEILRLVGRGWSNAEIAADLHLAPGTVKVHVSSILRTTGARNRVEAALVAVHADALDTLGDPPHRNR